MLLVAFLSFFCATGQTLICDSNVVLKRGIYRNFEEFRTNSPSLDEIEFSVDTLDDNIWGMGLDKHISYRIVLENSNELTNKDSVWGFCDGQSVYINDQYVYKKKNIHDKLLYIGRYCIYEYMKEEYIPSGGYGMVPGVQVYRKLVTMGINFNNGVIFQLNKANLKKILTSDQDLLDDFNEEFEKSKYLREYLIEFSESHRDKIKR